MKDLGFRVLAKVGPEVDLDVNEKPYDSACAGAIVNEGSPQTRGFIERSGI